MQKNVLKSSLTSFFLRIYPIVVICALGIILYSNSFDCSFHFDDTHNIINNEIIRDIKDIKSIWNFGFHGKTRFIGYISFALNYHFHQLDVFGYHAVNVIIHLISSCFVWWLLLLILSTPVMRNRKISTSRELIALGCGLLFVSHPVQTQSVTYIVQRFTSLAALFYLASLCFYLKARLSEKKHLLPLLYSLSALAALLGMLTKEFVFTLPFAMLLMEFGFMRNGGLKEIVKDKKIFFFILPPLLFTLIIPGLLSFSFSDVLGAVSSDRYNDPQLSPFIYSLTQLRVIPYYIKLLFLPIHQNLDYDFPASEQFFESSTFPGFLFLGTLLVIAVLIFPRKRLMSLGIFWFFITLSVESVKPLHNVIFEHRLYLPMFGFGVFFMSTLYYSLWSKHAKAAAIIFVGVICSYSALTYQRNKVWKDDFTLWSDVIKKSPDKARPHNNLGNALYSQGKYNQAIEEYKKSLEINPYYTVAYNNLGNALIFQEKVDEGIAAYHKALEINSYDSDVLANLGRALYSQGKIDDAIAVYKKALKVNPLFADVHYYIGNAFFSLGEVEEAISAYRRAVQINPDHAKAYNNLGNAFGRQGNLDDAVLEYYRALAIDPDFADAHKNLGRALFQKDQLEKAAEHLKIALSIETAFETHFILGIVLKEQGKTEDAVNSFQAAARLKPDIIDTHLELALCYEKLGKADEARTHTEEAERLRKMPVR